MSGNVEANAFQLKTSPKSIPRPACYFGYAGVIPFAVLSLLMLVGPVELQAQLHETLVFYGVAIISFMGGVHWGLAMNCAEDSKSKMVRYGVSVVPALVGWVTFFIAVSVQLIWLAAAFATLLIVDTYSVRLGYAPIWYARLRRNLTVLVVAFLIAGAFAING